MPRNSFNPIFLPHSSNSLRNMGGSEMSLESGGPFTISFFHNRRKTCRNGKFPLPAFCYKTPAAADCCYVAQTTAIMKADSAGHPTYNCKPDLTKAELFMGTT